MCYSEPLHRENGLCYPEEHGYVYVGYKCVIRVSEKVVASLVAAETLTVELERAGINAFSKIAEIPYEDLWGRQARQIWGSLGPMFPNGFVPMNSLVVDGHGFHVAATEESAIRLSPGRARPYAVPACRPHEVMKNPSLLGLPPISVHTRSDSPFSVCRVLVPGRAINQNFHAHACVFIPPGSQETEEDIALCDKWHRQHPDLTLRDSVEEVKLEVLV
jgi:hypothetical protein